MRRSILYFRYNTLMGPLKKLLRRIKNNLVIRSLRANENFSLRWRIDFVHSIEQNVNYKMAFDT